MQDLAHVSCMSLKWLVSVAQFLSLFCIGTLLDSSNNESFGGDRVKSLAQELNSGSLLVLGLEPSTS